MMMNTDKIYKACGMALIAALCAGCTDDASLDGGVGGSQGGAYITLTVPSGITPATRTVLPGQQNVQHATRIALYAFKHGDGETDTLKAKCIGGMSFDEVKWNQDLDHAMQEDGTSTQSQRVSLTQRWGISEANPDNWNATYTFLAIGSDDVYATGEDGKYVNGQWAGSNSTAAYGLGADDYFSKDETLGDCYAELQDNKSVDDIHQSELFAGTLTCKGSEVAGKEINLYRRVAGVKGYFRRIPKEVGDEAVNELRVVYFNSQATSVPYFKRWPQGGIFSDYDKREGSPLNGVSVSKIPDDDPTDNTISKTDLDECTYFTISKGASGEFVSQDGTAEAEDKENEYDYVTAGSYVLPAPGAPTEGGKESTTLYVVLVSEPDAAANVKILKKYRVLFAEAYDTRSAETRTPGVTDQGTGVIVGQEPDKDALDRERHYPIIANNYYTIGTAQEPIDMSTGETEVNIYVDPRWEGDNNLGGIIPKP